MKRKERVPSLDVIQIATIDDIPRSELLSSSAGSFQNATRLRQLETDGRWAVKYLVVAADDSPVLILPTYECQASAFPDSAFDVSTHAPSQSSARQATDWLLVGGRADLACGILYAADRLDAQRPESLLRLKDALRDVSVTRRRRCAGLYVRESDFSTFTMLLGPRVATSQIAQTSSLDILGDDDQYLRSLKASHRDVVRRDWRKLASAGISSRPEVWEELLQTSSEMIASLTSERGTVDHPRLIRYRLELWLSNREVQPVAFTVTDGDGKLLAVSLGWRWRDELQLYEIGLCTRGTPHRHLAYLEAMIYAPRRYAAAVGCTALHLGLFAAETKRIRGARIEAAYSFVS